MEEKEITNLITSTKKVVLSCIGKYLYERFYEAIDDVAQETYFRIYKALKKNQFNHSAKITTWAYTIAKNETFRMNEKLLREERKIVKLKPHIKEKYSENPEEEELQENLNKWLKKLPQKYRIVIMEYSVGKSEKEIAESLSLKQGTVKSRLYRGKKILEGLLKGVSR
ncbi:MAG: RNA polymerase sigma factor [Leptospiraceae bacterium]|nr:RNA polymerase sigma factor [Leptospiraceae bacterium]MCP5497881.1 RNA polymerase sigma factor [Leptospiraceae bacterium]